MNRKIAEPLVWLTVTGLGVALGVHMAGVWMRRQWDEFLRGTP